MRIFIIFLIIGLSTLTANADGRALFGLRGSVKRTSFITWLSYIGFMEELADVFEFSPEGELQSFSNNEKKSEHDDVNICRKEAIRVIKPLTKFTPGKMNGKPERTSMSLPVTFKLN